MTAGNSFHIQDKVEPRWGMVILAQTACDCKFNVETQKCFCLLLPAAIAAARKFKPPALRVAVDGLNMHCVSASLQMESGNEKKTIWPKLRSKAAMCLLRKNSINCNRADWCIASS